jgi:DNA-binding NarL/FixJ family response regulator
MHDVSDGAQQEGPGVFLAEANALVRAGLRSFLSREGFRVVGEANCTDDVIESVAALSPDVVLLDCSLPGGAMLALHHVRVASATTVVVLLADSVQRQDVVTALEGGANGYLLKDQDCADLAAGVRLAAAGGAPIAPKAMAVLAAEPPRGDPLTPREREVLEMVAEGLANKQIARALGITEATVKAHVGGAFRRIGVTTRTQAALWVHAQRLAREAPGKVVVRTTT